MILVIYFIEALGPALMAFLIAWWLVGRDRRGRLQLDMRDQVSAWLLTALATALIRIAVVATLGANLMQRLWTNRGEGLIGGFGLPLAAALIISWRLCGRARGPRLESSQQTTDNARAGKP